jgi:hypothetical protein
MQWASSCGPHSGFVNEICHEVFTTTKLNGAFSVSIIRVMMETESVSKTSGFINLLTWLSAQENFIGIHELTFENSHLVNARKSVSKILY